MTKTHLKPILNSTLPSSFRRIQLQLARDSNHPFGETSTGYVIVAPLDADGRIDSELWKHHREACRVARLRPGQGGEFGHLIHRPGGSWAFQYGTTDNDLPDETGYHFSDEHFGLGEYVSVRENGALHTFRVVSVSRL